MEQRPRSWTARVGIAAFCGLLVAVVSLVGYEPSPRNAGAAIQPAPTPIAFVPTFPEPPQERAVQASRTMASPGFETQIAANADASARAAGSVGHMVAPEAPEPAAALLPEPEACSFPCFDPDAEPSDETDPTGDDPDRVEPPETVVELNDDAVQQEAGSDQEADLGDTESTAG